MEGSKEQEARFERVYREHAATVVAYALRRAVPDEAADAAAETFVVAWRRLGEVADDRTLPWLLAITRRTLSNQRRSRKRQEAVAARVALQRPDQVRSASEGVAPPVLRALAELREDEREVLMLTAWEELSSKEAAAVLKCSPTAYRIRLHRARLRLRAALSALEATEPLVHNFVRPNIEESSSC